MLSVRAGIALLTAFVVVTAEIPCPPVADVGFLLDSGGSIDSDTWNKVTGFVVDVAKHFNFGQNGSRFGVTSFRTSTEGVVLLPLKRYNNIGEFEQAVSGLRYRNEQTSTAAGLRNLQTLLFYSDLLQLPKIGVIVTGGISTVSQGDMDSERMAAFVSGIKLYAVAIGDEVSPTEIDDLSWITAKPERVVRSRSFSRDSLKDSEVQLKQVICRDFSEGEDPCQKRDIMFMLDSSGSIGRINFNRQKNFVKRFAKSVPLGGDKNRIGVGSYSTKAHIDIALGEESDAEILGKRMEKIPWANQRTNIYSALSLVSSAVFPSGPARLGHESILVLFTDGPSNTESTSVARAAAELKRKYIRIYTVGLGERTDESELTAVASFPAAIHKPIVSDMTKLDQPEHDVFLNSSICYAEKVAHYMPPAFSCHSDIVISLSSSRQFGSAGFDRQKELVIKSVSMLGKYSCKFGLIIPSGNARVIRVSEFSTLENFISSVRNLRYQEGGFDNTEFLNSVLRVFGKRASIRTPTQRKFGHSAKVEWNPEDDTFTHNSPLPRVLVVFTDQEPAEETSSLASVVEDIHKNVPRLAIIAVGVGRQVSNIHLETLASKPSSMFIVRAPSLDYLLSHESLELVLTVAQLATPAVWSCDFEKTDLRTQEQVPDLCGLRQEGGDFDWTLHSGPTPSRDTGPEKAFNGSFYAYIEATGRQPGETAVLMGEPYTQAMEFCFWFYYNMDGWHTGRLEVVATYPNYPGEMITLWSAYGAAPKKGWHLASVHVYVMAGSRLGMRATRGEGFSGDIAVDGVSLTYGPCLAEKSFNRETSDYEWTLESGVNTDKPKSVNKYYGYGHPYSYGYGGYGYGGYGRHYG